MIHTTRKLHVLKQSIWAVPLGQYCMKLLRHVSTSTTDEKKMSILEGADVNVMQIRLSRSHYENIGASVS